MAVRITGEDMILHPSTALRTGSGIDVVGRMVAALKRGESYGQDIPSGWGRYQLDDRGGLK